MKTPSKKPYTINPERHEVWIGTKEVKLAPKEFDLLVALDSTRVTMTRDELGSILWPGKKPPKCFRTVDQHLARLRRKMRPVNVVSTVTNRGYKITL